MKKKNKTVIHTGTSSLILIFAILSLVVFSMLSLASANAQRQLAGKLADHTAAYYEAETRAQETLAQVIFAVQQNLEEIETGKMQLGERPQEERRLSEIQAGERLQEKIEPGELLSGKTQLGEAPEGETASGDESCPRETVFHAAKTAAGELGLIFEEDCISWQVPVTENQHLQVRMRILPEAQGKKWWKLEQWKLEYTGEWENKQTLELFGAQEGEEETCR